MVKPEQLQKLGMQISQDYLENQIPLTQGLEKVATINGLNANQVYRVAEAANVKTYLELMKTAEDDAYIEFDVADPVKVVDNPTIKKANHSEDYLESPGTSWAEALLAEKQASLHKEEELQKEAEEEERQIPA